jgi:hypothetical protein
MGDKNTTAKHTRMKWGIIFLSVFIACISTQMLILVILFIVQMPFIVKSQMLSALISITGYIAALVLAIVTFKKTTRYLSKYMHINK